MSANYNYDDKILFLRIAQGEEEAFNEIFYRYHRCFYAAAVKMTHSQPVAEELVQDVFVTLWIKREELQHIEKPFSYLFTALYNSIYSYLKKLAAEHRKLRKAGEEMDDLEEPADTQLLLKEQQHLVSAALRQLPEQQRKVYRLIKQQGMSREEAARILGLSPHTVRNHLQEATKNLLIQLQKLLSVILCATPFLH